MLLLKVKEGFLRLPAGPGLPFLGPSGGGVCHPVQPMTSRIGRVATTSYKYSTKIDFSRPGLDMVAATFFTELYSEIDERPFFNDGKYCQRGAIIKQFL